MASDLNAIVSLYNGGLVSSGIVSPSTTPSATTLASTRAAACVELGGSRAFCVTRITGHIRWWGSSCWLCQHYPAARSHRSTLGISLHYQPFYRLFAVAESHLDSRITEGQVGVENFYIIKQDPNSEGGGLALYVHNSLKVSVITRSNTEHLEKLGIPEYRLGSVQQGRSTPVFVAVIYRLPYVPFLRGTNLVQQLPSVTPSYFTYLDLKSVDSVNLISTLSNCDWALLDCPNFDIDAGLTYLSSNLMQTLDAVTPLKTFALKHKLHP
ncbi:hypothetical protein TSAR_003902, partial [Trichomalopsis sarcophagae]